MIFDGEEDISWGPTIRAEVSFSEVSDFQMHVPEIPSFLILKVQELEFPLACPGKSLICRLM